MDAENYLTQFFIRYRAASHTRLDREQFLTLLVFFPALLVIGADENIDEEEWIYVEYIAKAMADVFREETPSANIEQLKEHFLADLKFLTTHMQQWKMLFLQSLKKYLEELPSISEQVIDVLYLFADASGNASSEEMHTIEEIRQFLGI
ncbi:MAG: hypothetical protein RMJ44_02270 [Cytophagales bacterium]|nr:hypothetical protein [Bernardetiaceae bacterium]MDW8209886.1 hypothetical protein [Cytophagales bacterium]